MGWEGDDRGWDGWMASPTWWKLVWVGFGSWWWTGKPGVLQSMGSQRVRYDWVTELNWKPLTVWITTNCGKFFKRWEYQTTLPASWETCMQVKKPTVRTRHGTMDWFQIGKGVCQGCILSPCLLNLCSEYIMRNTRLNEAQLESRLQREKSITLDTKMTPPLWHKVKKN